MERGFPKNQVNEKKEIVMEIKNAVRANTTEILRVHENAFGKDKGFEIKQLVNSLLEDGTAKPSFSFVAVDNDTIVGHVLFTRVIIDGASEGLPAQILAPLAVLPDCQNKGVGGRLVKSGIEELRKSGIKVVFVLGHPNYYPRYGFTPAGIHGFEAPYPIPDEHADAWMVQELCPGIIGVDKGKVSCSDSLNKPEHWQD